MNLLIIALVPVFIILVYVYSRDRYEREPLMLLFEGLVAGGVIVFPVVYFENHMQQLGVNFAVYVLIWKNPEFNELFDGVVYAVFVSLGFALVENIGYVFGSETGIKVGLMRAFTAVPAHAMFGVMMGYRFGLARFIPSKRLKYLGLAFLVPFLFHGVYDFILMSQNQFLIFLFLPFVCYLLWRSMLRIKQLVPNSAFNPDHHKED